MALTSPKNIWTPDAGEQYALTTDLATMADTINDNLVESANYGIGTTAEMNAAVGRFPNGALWYNTTNSTEYRRVAGIWEPQDTGWQTLTLSPDFVAYGGTSAAQWKRSGDTIYIGGAVSPANSTVASAIEGAGGSGAQLFNLTDNGIPFAAGGPGITSVNHGSGLSKWLLQGSLVTGNFSANRYDGTANTTTWLPFFVSFPAV